ncbi:hypothetical protein JI721_12020 [Alicyclobacillus cycloheptanicus]|uniref:Uncharacterized protein n=1 Tax=Alicyclobacillus cycloheptanicus TaxID=1457 RepID=A0ABT9XM29_9BACL|nr:hypothetical protein [Alicyclobacillus cycloheptanicus]MDQ0191282.1 hypothetical protein [Alicyclobacillus cycloheptanicus]WDM00445.1 hypothetical protein JI721_12020 [Alicyclobacillus cycloheptanicus]
MDFRTMYRWGIPLVIVLFGIAVFAWPHRVPPIPKDYTLPNDNFDKATMEQIQSDLDQYNVAQAPQDHEVYMVTGGLGVANPRILGWDSGGNMTFAFNGPPGTTFDIEEMGQSPMTWKEVIAHGKLNPKTKKDITFTYQPLHWIKHVAKSGEVYYKLDDPKQTPQYFFQKGNTFIIVRPFPQDVFPTGLMNHLVPIGNPVHK